MSDTSSVRILVMGCGGIGGTVTAHLAEVGADVTGVTTNDKIATAVGKRGFRITGDGNPRMVPGHIELGVPEGAEYDWILLATQPPQVEDAARTALPHLADGGNMVVFQNGLCEYRVADIAGPSRVVGAIVSWGAAMPEPGVYDRTAAGGFTLGRIDGQLDDQVRGLAQLLEVIGPASLTSNLAGARWSKLAINCAISSLGTLAGQRVGPLVRMRRVRRLALEIFTEVVAVARAEGVRLEKVSGTVDLEWMAMGDAERRKAGSPALTAKHALLLAIGLRYRRMRSSMLSAIERGRTPAIDFLNGEIVSRAKAHGIAVPVNERIVERVHALARGEATPGHDQIDALFAETPRAG